MNVTIDKSAAEFAHTVEHGVMVVDGECPHGKHRPNDHLCRIAGQVPPADLVALTEPCETCRRHVGAVEADSWDLNDPNNHLGWVPCPDCDGRGFPLLIVRTECEHCDGKGVQGGEHDGATAWYCQHCWTTDYKRGGYVTTEFRVTDVPPIVATLPEAPTDPCVEVVEHSKPGRVTLLHFRDAGRMRSRFIDLPPDARPGQYAVIVERVDR